MGFRRSLSPKAHPLIDLNDLQANGKLLTDSQIRLAKLILAAEESAVFASAKLSELIENHAVANEVKAEDKNFPFRILKLQNMVAGEDAYFAIYKGHKQGKALGVGASGTVKIIQELDSSELYALKVISYDRTAASDEFKILDRLGETCGIVVEKNIPGEFGAGKYYFLMHLGKGKNLLHLLEEHISGINPIPTAEWLEICSAILKAVQDIHQKGVYHRDLKLENIIYDQETKTLKIVDFGSACLFTKENPIVRGDSHGTEGYKAPEIDARGEYSEKTEVFALGVLFKKLLGYENFVSYEDELLQNNSTQKDLEKTLPTLPSLLYKMSRTLPENRRTVADVDQKLNQLKTYFLQHSQQTAATANNPNTSATTNQAGFFALNINTPSPISPTETKAASTGDTPKKRKSREASQDHRDTTSNPNQMDTTGDSTSNPNQTGGLSPAKKQHTQ